MTFMLVVGLYDPDKNSGMAFSFSRDAAALVIKLGTCIYPSITVLLTSTESNTFCSTLYHFTL